MPSRRPAHAKAHAECPYGQSNWADCDSAANHRWGMCKALVQQKKNRDPEECSNWAVGEVGWCGQHYASKIEDEARIGREADRVLQLAAQMDAYFAATGGTPHTCDGIDCVYAHRSARHVCDPECSYSPEAKAKGEERRRLIELGERMAAGGGLEPPTSRVTADRSTSELPRKGKGPHRLTELA